MGYLEEKELDSIIAGLVELRNKRKDAALPPAIEALKEYRDRRMHWKNLAQGIRVLHDIQKANLRETDDLRRALIGR